MKITNESIEKFLQMETEKEVRPNTLTAYRTDLRTLQKFMDGRDVTKKLMIDYKEYLTANYKTETCNRRLRTARQFLKENGKQEAVVKPVPVKRNLTPENIMTVSDLDRMLRYADKLGRTQAKAIMQVIAGTGIRFNELQFLTVEAVQAGFMTVTNKGSVRDIPLAPVKKILQSYCKEQGIHEGVIFLTRFGNPISNSQLSRELKYIAGQARVNKKRIHPHSFRHLFAVHYLENGDVMELKNILGHRSLETTSIYTRLTPKQLGQKMMQNSLLNRKKTKRK